MSDRRSTPRNVLSKLLKPSVSKRYYQNVIVPADRVIDSALDDMETEEPSFMDWLERNPDLDTLLSAHQAAVYRTITHGSASGVPIEKVIQRIDALTYRLTAAIALSAVRHERGATPFSFERFYEDEFE